jgi:hypothetical protein
MLTKALADLRKDNAALLTLVAGSLSVVALLAFVSYRDSCQNPSYARFMGTEVCSSR